MKPIVLGLALLLAVAAVVSIGLRQTFGGGPQEATKMSQSPSLYDLKTKTLEGEPADLSQYRGQVALVVNVASKCGFTPQYEGLEKLYQELHERGFVVLGFPSNDFKQQEPGSAEEIRSFCTLNYGVTFPLFEKRKVTGDDKDAVYKLLTKGLEEPTWNFTKYLVDKNGKVLARFAPQTKPDDPDLRARIEEALKG